MSITVYTVGHSTRAIEEFIRILRAYHIQTVVDVRTIPRSRRNPQYNQDELRESLQRSGMAYVHMAGLGGLRHSRTGSPNSGWENLSFRGFAEYMQTPESEENLGQIIQLARESRIVLICAEAVPWRCHRSLIGDALLLRGVLVQDILSQKSAQTHVLTPWAVVDGQRITYPPPAP